MGLIVIWLYCAFMRSWTTMLLKEFGHFEALKYCTVVFGPKTCDQNIQGHKNGM